MQPRRRDRLKLKRIGEKLKKLFALCEAYRFTIDFDETADAKQIVRDATRIVKAVERNLK